ncbi:hypothetical protein, partial [Candidatus Venteria ishoeyi]|uniref:hypothetical protein n=1 Tax=Candidatus Venteria ishoeyi TaxID=1899563 RepID=UPI0011B081C2
MKENNFIDELFDKELGAYEMGTASQGWAAVASGLGKKGFLAFLKSSLWLKVAAGISTAGLIIFIGLIVINPDYFTQERDSQDDNIICQPTGNYQSPASNLQPVVASSQSTVASQQSTVGSSQLADNINNQQNENEQNSEIKIANTTFVDNNKEITELETQTSNQSSVGSLQLAESDEELIDNINDRQTKNETLKDSETEIANPTFVENTKEATELETVNSQQSSVNNPHMVMDSEELADNINDQQIKKENVQNSETEIANSLLAESNNKISKGQTSNSKPETRNNQQSTVSSIQSSVLSSQSADDSQKLADAGEQLADNINDQHIKKD